MKLLQVAFLALWQLTAVPFVGMITAHAVKSNDLQESRNLTVAYKSPAE